MPFSSKCRFHALAVLFAMPLAGAAGPSAPAVDAKNSVASPKPLEYQSSLSGYQPHADPNPIPWVKANETVRQKGGWRAYAKEGEPQKPDGANVTPKSGGHH